MHYDADSRWVDILSVKTGWAICNMGQNGREIPSSAPFFPADTDLLIIMLGTNDLLQGRSPEQAAERLERFLSGNVTRHTVAKHYEMIRKMITPGA